MEAFEEFEDKSGMTTVSGTVILKKNEENLIGISIGGGSPFCPCLYIVQVQLLNIIFSFLKNDLIRMC